MNKKKLLFYSFLIHLLLILIAILFNTLIKKKESSFIILEELKNAEMVDLRDIPDLATIKIKDDNKPMKALKKHEINKQMTQEEFENIKEPIETDIEEKKIEEEIIDKKFDKKEKINKTYDPIKSKMGNSPLSDYRDEIYEKVYSNWEEKQSFKKGWTCKVIIQQNLKGEILDALYKEDCKVDKDFRTSIKLAIEKSTPLPLPKEKFLFSEYIEINFNIK